jgi:hypothetical protein
MTARQRAQVVELLRCAADLNVLNPDHGIAQATEALDSDEAWQPAYNARQAARNDGPTEYRHTCLEAAIRIEQGWEP